MVMFWMMSSVQTPIVPTSAYCSSAKAMWELLRQTYSHNKKLPRFFKLMNYLSCSRVILNWLSILHPLELHMNVRTLQTPRANFAVKLNVKGLWQLNFQLVCPPISMQPKLRFLQETKVQIYPKYIIDSVGLPSHFLLSNNFQFFCFSCNRRPGTGKGGGRVSMVEAGCGVLIVDSWDISMALGKNMAGHLMKQLPLYLCGQHQSHHLSLLTNQLRRLLRALMCLSQKARILLSVRLSMIISQPKERFHLSRHLLQPLSMGLARWILPRVMSGLSTSRPVTTLQ